MKIAVVSTGYVVLSIATLLTQHYQVTAVDVMTDIAWSITVRVRILLRTVCLRWRDIIHIQIATMIRYWNGIVLLGTLV